MTLLEPGDIILNYNTNGIIFPCLDPMAEVKQLEIFVIFKRSLLPIYDILECN